MDMVNPVARFSIDSTLTMFASRYGWNMEYEMRI